MTEEKPESSAPPEGQTLGQFLAAARESRGFSRGQIIAEARIPEHYLKMIETGDYHLVSDQLYLVPYLRRYAAFVGLDAEEIAARFVREVQSAETSIVRVSEPFAMITHQTRGGRLQIAPRLWIAVLLAAAILIPIAFMAIRRAGEDRRAAGPAITPAMAVVKSQPAARPPRDASPTPSAAPAAAPS
ncbi:MAG: helix-turn-helix domain-containing protein [Candidatus Binataceae bacterium]